MKEPCPYCKGTGLVSVGCAYLATYIALCNAGEIHAAELAGRMQFPVSNEAMCNRLAALEKKGLATSRVAGRRRLYKAVGEIKARKRSAP